MARRHLLGPEGGDDDEVAPVLGDLACLPAVEQRQRHGVGPLAVVEEDEDRLGRPAQDVEELQQGLDAARLAVVLRPEPRRVDGAEQGGQRREGRRRGVRPVAELGPEPPGEHRVQAGGDDAVRDALQHLEGPGGGLIDTLAPQDEGVVLGGVQRQLVEEAGLAGARLGLHEEQPARGRAVLAEHPDQLAELHAAPDEGGLGEHVAPVVRTRRHGGFRRAGSDRGGDGVDVAAGGGGGLVPDRGVLRQQALQDALERPGHRDAHRPQLRRGDIEVLTQHLPDGAATERGAPGQALEEHDADGVEIGPLVDHAGDQAGGLGCDVAHGPRRLAVEVAPACEAEVDQLRRQGGAVASDDDVRRLDVTVQHAELVHRRQGGQEARREREAIGDGERAVGEDLVEGLALDVRLHHVEEAVTLTAPQHPPGPAEIEALEEACLVVEPHVDGRGDGGGLHRLDHDVGSVQMVDAAVGVDPVALLDEGDELEPAVDVFPSGRRNRGGSDRCGRRGHGAPAWWRAPACGLPLPATPISDVPLGRSTFPPTHRPLPTGDATVPFSWW